MSVNLSANLSANISSFSGKFSKKKEEDDNPEQKKKSASKQNPLLNSKTEPYVDDSDAFSTRITKAQKYEYWTHLLQNRGTRRPLPKAFKSWKSREIAKVNEQANYLPGHIRTFNFISTARWDQRSLNLFIIFLLLTVFYADGYALSISPKLITMNSMNQIIALPLFLMFLCQLVPFFGMLYFITHRNDLVHFKAVKEIGTWALGAALTAQYVEFFLYRGQGHAELAGNCKIGHDVNPTPILDFARKTVNILRNRNHAKIDKEEDEESGSDDNSGEQEDEEKGKAGKLKSAMKKPADADKAGGEKGSAQAGAGAGAEAGILKKKPSSAGKRRKSSASIAPDAKGGEDAVSRRKSGEIVDFDADGNEIPKVPIPHTEWDCVVCNKHNRRPTHGPVESDIWFGEKGVYYKRTYAVIQARRDVPTCVKCGTYSDYVPPLGSAHLFKFNPTPHVAFDGYPIPSTVQAGLKPDIQSRYYYAMKGFFFGIKDDINSAPLKNDWRLEKFVNNRFPELPRYKLQPGELYQVGEIVECKQQKFAWARARIQVAHANHTYDIRYDPGDEIRFVVGSAIRTIPDKRAFAFRVEMGLVVICILSPLGMAMGLLSDDIGQCMTGLLMVSTTLLAIRLTVFVQYFYNYFHAGLLSTLMLTSIYTLPLLFLMIASAVGVSSGGTDPSAWTTVTVLLILTKVFSLPFLYIYRPTYLVIGGSCFFLSSIGMIGLSMYASNPASVGLIALPLAPIYILAIWLKIIRANLHNAWDVCLIMRKAKDTEFENPSIVGRAQDLVMEYIDP